MNLDRTSLAVLFLATCALAAASQNWAAETMQEYAGEARVIDGDTLEIAGARIRLAGMDACEMGQPALFADRRIDCGAWAKEQMEALLADAGLIRCESREQDHHGPIAVCFTGRRNINLAALQDGYAFLHDAERQPAAYRRAEQAAREDGKGIWTFREVITPHDYRQATW